MAGQTEGRAPNLPFGLTEGVAALLALAVTLTLVTAVVEGIATPSRVPGPNGLASTAGGRLLSFGGAGASFAPLLLVVAMLVLAFDLQRVRSSSGRFDMLARNRQIGLALAVLTVLVGISAILYLVGSIAIGIDTGEGAPLVDDVGYAVANLAVTAASGYGLRRLSWHRDELMAGASLEEEEPGYEAVAWQPVLAIEGDHLDVLVFDGLGEASADLARRPVEDYTLFTADGEELSAEVVHGRLRLQPTGRQVPTPELVRRLREFAEAQGISSAAAQTPQDYAEAIAEWRRQEEPAWRPWFGGWRPGGRRPS